MDALILPLHGSLPHEMQVRVFSPTPPNCRRFFVATNIAETSLTVDGVVYVIDSGYVKQRQYNPATGMYSLDVVQISKRAHCRTLYLVAELPLEPSLSRTLIEANEFGCLSQAPTVQPCYRKNDEDKRKHPPLELPHGSGFGDHIQLLQIYECWDENDYKIDWCRDYDLEVGQSIDTVNTKRSIMRRSTYLERPVTRVPVREAHAPPQAFVTLSRAGA
ncbi:RNA helicase family protein isoform 3 [Hibiscus syriacus]|uniref:RNA helicase n=1 Tax=Hibiscus syriacus TaxID=106335 RepID=A0A6A2ZXB7_HIBSY|nr:RNA helicase family protein isoform 3 [Hibiscus syriacus]